MMHPTFRAQKQLYHQAPGKYAYDETKQHPLGTPTEGEMHAWLHEEKYEWEQPNEPDISTDSRASVDVETR